MDIRNIIKTQQSDLLKSLLDTNRVNLRENYDPDIVDSNSPLILDLLEKKGYRTFIATWLLDGVKGEKIAIHVMKTHIRRSITSCELLRLACAYSEAFFAEEFVDICDEPDFKQLKLLTENPEIIHLLSQREKPTNCCFFQRK